MRPAIIVSIYLFIYFICLFIYLLFIHLSSRRNKTATYITNPKRATIVFTNSTTNSIASRIALETVRGVLTNESASVSWMKWANVTNVELRKVWTEVNLLIVIPLSLLQQLSAREP